MAATTSTALPGKPYNVLLVLLAVHKAGGQLPLTQRVPGLDFAL